MKAAIILFSLPFNVYFIKKKKIKKKGGSSPVKVVRRSPQPFLASCFLELSQLHPLWCQASCTASLSKGEQIPWLWLHRRGYSPVRATPLPLAKPHKPDNSSLALNPRASFPAKCFTPYKKVSSSNKAQR